MQSRVKPTLCIPARVRLILHETLDQLSDHSRQVVFKALVGIAHQHMLTRRESRSPITTKHAGHNVIHRSDPSSMELDTVDTWDGPGQSSIRTAPVCAGAVPHHQPDVMTELRCTSMRVPYVGQRMRLARLAIATVAVGIAVHWPNLGAAVGVAATVLSVLPDPGGKTAPGTAQPSAKPSQSAGQPPIPLAGARSQANRRRAKGRRSRTQVRRSRSCG